MSILEGLRVVEFDAIGPVPFCGKLLSDHGAQVIRVGRPGGQSLNPTDEDLLLKGRPTFGFDLKQPADREEVRALIGASHVLIEGFRPGVMERLGLGPEVCMADNPALVYGRMTGYGQSGPLALNAGHDINYISLTAALHAIGDSEHSPPPPLNLVGDFGGGAMLLAFGVLAARLHALATGRGEIVDAAMVDGSAQLMAMIFGWRNANLWSDERNANLLDGGAPFYRTYRTKDGRFIAIGAIEAKFYAAMRRALRLDDPLFDAQWDRRRWPAMHAAIARLIAAKNLAEWGPAMTDPEACLSPVLCFDDVAEHPHIAARRTVTRAQGADGRSRLSVGPAPRFLREGDAPPIVSADPLRGWPLSDEIRAAVTRRSPDVTRIEASAGP